MTDFFDELSGKLPGGFPPQAGQRIMDRAAELAGLTSVPGMIHRAYLTDAHRAANAQVGAWMEAAGLSVHMDPAGSMVGRLAAADPDAPVLVVGSHVDSVPNAGAYDGVLGVLVAIEAAELLSATAGPLPYTLEVIAFGEEEGVRFGTTLMTSRARAGSWDPAWWALEDVDGLTLARAFEDFGLDPARIEAACPEQNLLGFIEVHIEQGPVLESLDAAVGVVDAIAGARRFQLRLGGEAGHAGTVPMAARRDALLGAAEAIVLVRELAGKLEVTATVGQLEVHPGAPNVIAGATEFSLDVRSGDDGRRDAFVDEFASGVAVVAQRHGLELEFHQTHQADAAPCAPVFQQRFASAASQLGLAAPVLSSGAGHDGMAMAPCCEFGMLFVRCAGGRSHHPDESISAADAACSLAVLHGFLTLTAESLHG